MNHWWDPLVSSLAIDATISNSAEAFTMLSVQGVEPAALLRAASDHYQVPWVELSFYSPDLECLRLIHRDQARRLQALPLFRVGNDLYVAVADPSDLRVQDFIAQRTGLVVEPVLASAPDIEEALNSLLSTWEHYTDTMQTIDASADAELSLHLGQSAILEDRDAPAIKLVDHMLEQAVRMGASDLHLEPFADVITLRYRIDGRLSEYPPPPMRLYNAVVSRIKIAAGLDIAERRMPQDGRFSIVVNRINYDLRVSVIPHVHGEGVVIRILNLAAVQLDLASLGFEPEILDRYRRILSRPKGMVLVTGPTGSGKSTTLYATLFSLKDVSKKTVTLEDPVEYQVPGINQIQVQPDIGYTFAAGLRAILRHDPDVVLVGEIRDLESAQIAIRAALSGHQMFSTLHTNDAPQAFTRLMDMGVPFYLLQAALNGILAQRLVRRLCSKCRRIHPLSQAVLADWHDEGFTRDTAVYEAVGCSECHGVGYSGRVAVHELLDITKAVRRLDPSQASPEKLAAVAQADGAFFSLRHGLAAKVKAGVTSLEEAVALLGEDD